VVLSTASFAQSRSLKNTDRYWEIGAGEIDRFTSLNKFGRNTDIDIATDPEDVWNMGGVQTFMTIAEPLYVSSSAAANDDDQIIRHQGLDENWDLQEVSVTPNNRTAVVIPAGNNTSYRVIEFASVTTGPAAGEVITQAVTGAQLSVVGSNTTDDTIWGVLVGATEFTAAQTVTGGIIAPSPATTSTVSQPCSLWIRSNRATNISGDALTGDLYIAEFDTLTAGVPDTQAQIHNKIDIGMEQTHSAIYSVPRGHNAYILKGYAAGNTANTGATTIDYQVRPFGGVFISQFILGLKGNASSLFVYEFAIPQLVPPKSDIKVQVLTVTSDNSNISAGFEFMLEDTR